MDGFPLKWCFKNSKAVLIKSPDLLYHWPSQAPVTLMEETIYQNPIHFKTLSAWLCSFPFFFFNIFFFIFFNQRGSPSHYTNYHATSLKGRKGDVRQ